MTAQIDHSSTGLQAIGQRELVVRDIKKSYGSTNALIGLSFHAPAGRITGIAGPNGAGKSTFVGILGGEIEANSGAIEIDGRPLDGRTMSQRVAIVHQEPQLFPNLTVWENVLVGHENAKWFRPPPPQHVEELINTFGLGQYRDAELSTVPLAAQQRVEVVRALARSVDVLVFDEPNSALSEADSAELFQFMHRLADEGRVVLLVSHRFGELVEHCSSVVVILDGKDRAILDGVSLTEQTLAAAMLNSAELSSAGELRAEPASQTSRPALSLIARGTSDGDCPQLKVTLRAGEVTAFVGVEGSGARAFVQRLGDSRRDGRDITLHSDTGSKQRHRTEFVPAHRSESLFANFSVAENIISRLGREIVGPLHVVSRRRVNEAATEAQRSMNIKAGALHHSISTLSGGNQQKVAIAAAIARNPELLVLEEPTRGVDLGSRAEIYRILRDYCDQGSIVCLYCTEVVEVFRAAHRAIVFREGRIAGDYSVSDFDDVGQLSHRIVEAEWGS